MDRETRDRLRTEVSNVLRALIEGQRGSGCSECRCELDSWTAGCRTCNLRHYGRLKRGRYPGGPAAYRRTAVIKFRTAQSLNGNRL